MNIATKVKKHLVGVTRSNEYRDDYVQDLVNDGSNQFVLLPSIAENHI